MLLFFFAYLYNASAIGSVNESKINELLSSIEQKKITDKEFLENTFESIEALLIQQPNLELHTRFLLSKSYFYFLERRLSDSLRLALEAIKQAEKLADGNFAARGYHIEGIVLQRLGLYSESLFALQQSLSLYNENNQFLDRINIIESVLNVYESLQDFENYYQYALLYDAEASKAENDSVKTNAQHYLGIANYLRKDFNKGREFLLQAERMHLITGDPEIGVTYWHLANLEFEQGQYEKAMYYLKQQESADNTNNINWGHVWRYILLGDVYVESSQPEKAAAAYLESLTLATEQEDFQAQRDVYEKLAELYVQMDEAGKALEYYQKYYELQKTLYSQQQAEQLTINKVRFETEQKNQQIKALELSNQLIQQRNKYQLIVVVLLLVLLSSLTIFYLRNLKQRKALQLSATKLQQATDAKSDFLARMSHEIRTPINAIIGLSKLTQKSMLDNQQQLNVQQILDSSNSLLGVINDILDFSKIEAGKLTIESIKFDLEKAVKQSLQLHALRAQEKRLELIQYISPEVPLQLIGDPLRIQQVLNNLLSNAIKFTEQGIVSISVHKKYSEQGIVLEFAVKDTGIGLSQEEQKKLFQSFSQADESTTRKYGGTGLGLAICKQLVELMNGNIWIESEPGQGTTFYFTLTVESEKQPAPNNIGKADLSALRILVVDDVELSLTAIDDALKSVDVSADLVNSAEAAIEKVRAAFANKKPYDFMIVDWKMPGIDGIELVSVLRQEFGLSMPEVLMVSAFEIDHVKQLGKSLGIKYYLEKPLDSSGLVNYLMEVVSGSKRIISEDKTDEVIPDLSSKHLLLVDDNELNRKVATGFLADTHVKLSISDNGGDAIEKLKAGQAFDAIMMDIQMPVMDGFQACKIIREELRSDIPIIAMTAQAMAGDKEKCLSAGMNGYISKPIEPELLYQVLAEILDTRQLAKQNDNINLNQQSSEPQPKSSDLLTVDENTAINALKGNRTLYFELVSDFVKMQPMLDDLQKGIAERDKATISEVVHAYKSSLAYIGANKLSDLAFSLEKSLRTSEFNQAILADCVRFRDASQQLIVKLASNQDNQKTEPQTEQQSELDQTTTIQLLDELIELLNLGDAKAQEYSRKIELLLSKSDFNAQAKAVLDDIKEFEFEQAADKANKLKQDIQLSTQ